MRTIQDVYNQLRWDPRFAAGSYRLGVQNRFGPIDEIPVLSFTPDGDVPWHRIVYVRGSYGVIWDRRTGEEDVHPPQKNAPTQELLNVYTWNLAAGKHGVPLEPRLPSILEQLQPLPGDLVALQEVGPELLQKLPDHPHRFQVDELVLYTARPPERLREIELSPGKSALLVDFPELLVAVVHLTSNFRADQAELRQRQWEVLARYLEGHRWIVLGDFNDRGTLHHHATDCTPPGPSFRPAHNRWAQQASRSGEPRHYQRILSNGYRATHQQIHTQVQASDHDPISATLELCHPGETSVRQALAIIPPRRLWKHFQPDPRWMPHLNLVYPGPVDLDRDNLRTLLSQQPRFQCRLETVDTFHHKNSLTHYWKPDPASTAIFRRLTGNPGLQPHFTVAKKDPKPKLPQVEFEVSSVVYLCREEGPFQIAEAFPLAPARKIPDSLPRPLITVGSTLLSQNNDLDLVHPTDEPEAELDNFQDHRIIGRVLRLPEVDVAFARVDPEDEHWRAVLDWEALFAQIQRLSDLETFQNDYQRFNDWLSSHSLRGQSWGWPGGLAWAVLLLQHGWPEVLEHDLPEKIESPAFPGRNLIDHLPNHYRKEFRRPQEPQAPALLIPSGHIPGLPFILEIRRRFGLLLRPYPKTDACLIPVPAEAAEPLLELAREHFGEASLTQQL